MTPPAPFRARAALLLGTGLFPALCALAQAPAPPGWEACAAVVEGSERLACFDRWTQAQQSPAAATAPASATAPVPPAAVQAAEPARTAAGRPDTQASIGRLRLTRKDGCRNPLLTPLSRFWELEGQADCGNFGLRGFHPTSLAIATADTVNTQPTSGNPVNNAAAPTPYRRTDMRLQLSVRTRVASDLLPASYAEGSDSIWFAYTQQSYWQLFTPALSRPFRSTDHEPEVIYVRPLQAPDPSRWRWRYAGLGLVHQSNGQSLPLSRSWNRMYLMAGAEHGSLTLAARVWKRLREDPASDDNPGISDFIGRAEVSLGWTPARGDQLQLTARHALNHRARGSLRLEWFHTLYAESGSSPSDGLQLHTQLFSGYGDSLLDFNRRRTMFSIGLSLRDW